MASLSPKPSQHVFAHALRLSLGVLACLCAFVCALVAAPLGSSGVAEANQRKLKRTPKQRVKRSPGAPIKRNRYYGALSLGLGVTGCIGGPDMCARPESDNGAGLGNMQWLLGYRFGVFGVALRTGFRNYSLHAATRAKPHRRKHAVLAELMLEGVFAPVGSHARWDPYIFFGGGRVDPVIGPRARDWRQWSGLDLAGFVGVGYDRFIDSRWTVGVRTELMALDSKHPSGEAELLWCTNLQIAYGDRLKPRTRRRKAKRRPRRRRARPRY